MLRIFRNVSKIEKPIIISGVVVLVFSFALLIVSVYEFGFGIANCETNIAPFQKGEVIVHDRLHYEVHYVAKMWSFDPPEVRVPPHAQVDIYLTSGDVTHGFAIPGTDVNLLAVPGAMNFARQRFDKTGTYPVICHEYCGTGHQNMATVITVEEPNIAKPEAETQAAAQLKAAPPGYKVLQDKGCVACHTVDGAQGTGPTFKGLWGKTETLSDGSSVKVDEAYVRESVLEPQAKIVKGFGPVMPKLPVSEAELQQIIDYLKQLK